MVQYKHPLYMKTENSTKWLQMYGKVVNITHEFLMGIGEVKIYHIQEDEGGSIEYWTEQDALEDLELDVEWYRNKRLSQLGI